MTTRLSYLRDAYVQFFRLHGWIPRGDTPTLDRLAECCHRLFESQQQQYRQNPSERLTQAMLAYASIGEIAVGNPQPIITVLDLLIRHPEIRTSRQAGMVLLAIQWLYPFPDTFAPLSNPTHSRDWIMDKVHLLNWNEKLEQYTID